MELSTASYEQLSQLIQQWCGLVVPPEKAYLIKQRLTPVAQQYGCATFEEFLQKLPDFSLATRLRNHIIEAITTHETAFFRDRHPFDTLRSHLLPTFLRQLPDLASVKTPRPKLADKVGKPINTLSAAKADSISSSAGTPTSLEQETLRIWCAGASTGQEAYTIAMCVLDVWQHQRNTKSTASPNTPTTLVPAPSRQSAAMSALAFAPAVEILATDISQAALEKAAAGFYSNAEVERGLSTSFRDRFLEPLPNCWQIRPEVRQLIQFRRLNLIEPFGNLGQFDLISCRNVLIYFSLEVRQQILLRFRQHLKPNGWLLLGAAENLLGIEPAWKSQQFKQTILFQRNNPP